VARQAFDQLRENRSTGVSNWFLRIELHGPSPLAQLLQEPREVPALSEDLAFTLGATHVEVDSSSLVAPVEVGNYLNEPNLVGALVRLILSAREDPEVLNGLTPATLAGAPSNETNRMSYLQKLLAGLEEEALSRFLKRHED
jgi:hypothetical protein